MSGFFLRTDTFVRYQLPVCLPAAHSAFLTSSPRIPPPNVALQPSLAMVVVFSFLILMLMPCCMFPNVLVPPCKPVVAKKGMLLALAYCTCLLVSTMSEFVKSRDLQF
jgi:hypothetical protein